MKSNEVADAIRQNVDIVQVINEVVPLRKSGGNFFGVCPFHNEKTPSLSVSPTKQLFHCFGCKVGGDIFKFVQLYFRWDFRQALEELARRAGIQLEVFRPDPEWEEAFAILEFVRESFEERLYDPSGKIFRDYLISRKIPEKLWKDFNLGAHPGEVHFLTEIIGQKGFSRDIAVRLGILGRTSRGEYIDRFQGRLMFPILDEKGRTRGFGGRSLQNEHPKYLNSPKSTQFDKGKLFYGIHLASTPISKKGYAVLVEGYLDVMALHEFGVTNAIGSMGTALTLEQIRVLKRWSSRVISLYDSDQAGVTATKKNLGNFLKEGIEVKVVNLPGSKDPDSYLHNEELSAEKRKENLRISFDKSAPALDYLIQNGILTETNAMRKGERLRELVGILDQVPDEIGRTLLKRDLAKRFDLPEQMLFGAAIVEKPHYEPPSKKPANAPAVDVDGRFERETLRFLVLFGDSTPCDLTEIMPYLSSDLKWSALLLRLIELHYDSTSISKLEWLPDIELEMQAPVREWVLDKPETLSKEEATALWSDILKGLRRSYFQKQSERLQRELAVAENNQNTTRARELLAEKRDLARHLKSL